MNAIEILSDEVEGTVFGTPDRFAAMARDIRTFLRGCDPHATSTEVATIVRAHPEAISGDTPRRRIIAEFIEKFDDLTAGMLLDEMEIRHVGA